MNSPQTINFSTEANPEKEADSEGSRIQLPQLLRVAGAMAIISSGLIYMLQGVYVSSGGALRDWIYLFLMAGLGLGGIFSFKFMEDRKRLFFTLSVLLVPVQFSQLGGLTYQYFIEGTTFPNAIAAIATSLVAAALVSLASFSILSRPYAKQLCLTFVLINALLLLPFRNTLYSLLPLGLIGLGIGQLYQRLFNRHQCFLTPEGLAVRLLFILPATIALAREGFHHSDTLGMSVTTFSASTLALLVSRYFSQHTIVREILILISYAFGSFAIASGIFDLFEHPNKIYEPASTIMFYSIPLVVFGLFVASLSRKCKVPIFSITALVLAFSASIVWSGTIMFDKALLLTLALAVSIYGVAQKRKIPFISGIVIMGLGTIDLLYASVLQIQVNTWVALAFAGLLLVLCSSIRLEQGRCKDNLTYLKRNSWKFDRLM